MSRDKPWLKMWTEWLGDIKMDRLSLAEQGAWWRLYALAHECGHRDEKRVGRDKKGKLTGGLVVAGQPLSLAEIMKSLKITEELDKATFNQMVEKMINAGNLHWKDDTLFITHYENEQRAATDTKEAIRQRVRDLREKQRAEKEKREPEKSPSPDIKEPEEEERGERKEHHAQMCNEKLVTHVQDTKSGNEKLVTPSDIIAEVTRLIIETNREPLTEVVADRIRQFAEDYTGPLRWIEKAYKQAAVHKRRWDYVQKIIQRWEDEGGPDDERERRDSARRERKEGSGAGAGEQRSAADRRDPLKADREAGWEVIRPDAGGAAKGGEKTG
jgi:hypothetical protein